MKSLISNLIILLAVISCIFLQSCENDDCPQNRVYAEYTAIYADSSYLEGDIEVLDPIDIVNPGKLYYAQNFILINEKYKGVHIIDNSDNRNPTSTAFINIEGNIDMALKGDFLYVDNYLAIMVLDISELPNVEVTCVIPKMDYSYIFGGIIDYVPSDNTLTFNCDDAEFSNDIVEKDGITYWATDTGFGGFPQVFFEDVLTNSGDATANGGQGGSLARFAFIADNFYYVNDYEMHVYDASDARKPVFQNTVYLEWGVETIFPYKENIFIGSQTGMHILDNSDPLNPQYISTFAHARACDPVVVEGDIAYVTLRNGTECEDFNNQLDIIDISNLREPTLIKTHPMDHPHGLAVRNDILYLCEGEFGLKIFDVSDKKDLDFLSHQEEKHFYDVISVTQSLLLSIGDDGFYQWDVSDPKNPEVLSFIEVSK